MGGWNQNNPELFNQAGYNVADATASDSSAASGQLQVLVFGGTASFYWVRTRQLSPDSTLPTITVNNAVFSSPDPGFLYGGRHVGVTDAPLPAANGAWGLAGSGALQWSRLLQSILPVLYRFSPASIGVGIGASVIVDQAVNGEINAALPGSVVTSQVAKGNVGVTAIAP